VGVVGLLLGGGLAMTSRLHGLCSDNVRQWNLILPNGTQRYVRHDNYPLLFNTLAGAGAELGCAIIDVDLALFPLSPFAEFAACEGTNPQLDHTKMLFTIDDILRVTRTDYRWKLVVSTLENELCIELFFAGTAHDATAYCRTHGLFTRMFQTGLMVSHRHSVWNPAIELHNLYFHESTISSYARNADFKSAPVLWRSVFVHNMSSIQTLLRHGMDVSAIKQHSAEEGSDIRCSLMLEQLGGRIDTTQFSTWAHKGAMALASLICLLYDTHPSTKTAALSRHWIDRGVALANGNRVHDAYQGYRWKDDSWQSLYGQLSTRVAYTRSIL
jgi:hypothetical protein